MKIIINTPPITKKNHQQIVRNIKTGIPFIIPSKEYRKYEDYCSKTINYRGEMIDYPVEVVAKFYTPTRRKSDLTNHLESIDDILVKCGVLADDNCSIIVSHDGSRVLYDKDNPRTEVEIRRYDEQDNERKET